MIELVLFVEGIAVGVVITTLVVLRIGTGLEDRAATLRDAPPTPTAAIARKIVGLNARMSAPVCIGHQPGTAGDELTPLGCGK